MQDEKQQNRSEIIGDSEKRLRLIKSDPSPITLLLDHPELPRNLAAIHRVVDAARIEKVYVFGEDISAEKRRKAKRVSRNAIEKIDTLYLSSLEDVRTIAQEKRLIALEYTNKSLPFNAYQNAEPCTLVIGNERSGVSKELLELCTQSLHIPMLGQNSSMNVAVATGIVVYHLLGNMGRI